MRAPHLRVSLPGLVLAAVLAGGSLAAIADVPAAVPGVPNRPPATVPPAPDVAPEAATQAGELRPLKPVVRGSHGMVVTANPHASRAAADVLAQGGHAADAAIAALLVLNVVEPQSSGMGGGGFWLGFDAASGRLDAWDGREQAPAALPTTVFLDAQGQPMAFFDAVVGMRSVGVPGLVRLMAEVHARDGRLPWPRLFAPAIALARDGFEVSPRLASLLEADRHLASDPAAAALFYPSGRALQAGDRLVQPALAQTLSDVAEGGADAFYRGNFARALVEAVASAPVPGFISAEDLAGYRAVRRSPLCGPFRQWRVCGMPPPSSGASTVLALLGMFASSDSTVPDPYGADWHHRFLEVGKLAFADRDAWLADPRSMPFPVEALIDADYLTARRALMTDQPAERMPAGRPALPTPPVDGAAPERPSTTHLSVVDADGNAVAVTASIENAFGARRMVRGVLLNNQLTDFSFVPTRADGTPHPNRPQPGMRPRSSMAPTLVFDASGQLHAVLGSPGGSAIINYVAAALIRLLDHDEPLDRLMAAPHAGSRNRPADVEDTARGRALADALVARGHQVRLRAMTSGLALVVRDGRDGWRGAADPRREGMAIAPAAPARVRPSGLPAG